MSSGSAGSAGVETWEPWEAALLDPEQELETVELGDRVGWWFTMWIATRGYGQQEHREQAATSVLVAEVAEATSHRGLPFPAEWWPPGYDLPSTREVASSRQTESPLGPTEEDDDE